MSSARFMSCRSRRVLSAVALALLALACTETTAVDRGPDGRLSPGARAAVVTPAPTSVTVAGDLQSELGCSGDWQPDCSATHLSYDANDDVWQGTWTVPTGSYEYKAALNDSWTENYGANAQQNGANIPLVLGASSAVKFYYDHKTHWITEDASSTIVVAPGSFQSELGCSGDWDAGCLRSWLEDPDDDGVFTFSTTSIPAGSYEAKVAIDESWNENYGANGTPGGANIPFTVPQTGSTVEFSYDGTTHVLTITVTPLLAPQTITITSALPASAVVGSVFTLSATGGASGNPVVFATQTSSTCSTTGTDGTTLTLVAAGTCTVQATQAGNATYDAATPVTVNVTVTTPTAALSALRGDVATSGIKLSVRSGLTDKLDAALAALAKGNTAAACNQLAAFESQVRSQRGKAIPPSTADAWLAESAAIRHALGC
jgi:hypothetical protein